MTRDDIIRMGQEADIVLYNGDDKSLIVWLMPSEEKFLKFAALVAAAEREACAKLCEDLAAYTEGDYLAGCTDCLNAIGGKLDPDSEEA